MFLYGRLILLRLQYNPHYDIVVNKDVVAFIYKSNACHSYNVIYINGQKVKVATIDTMLSFYLIFIYANRPYYDENRLLCMSEYLFKVQLKNRLQQKGLLRRFSVMCYGKQKTLEDIRSEKANIFKELKEKKIKKGTGEYNVHFLRYIPSESKQKLNKSITAKGKIKSKKSRRLRKR